MIKIILAQLFSVCSFVTVALVITMKKEGDIFNIVFPCLCLGCVSSAGVFTSIKDRYYGRICRSNGTDISSNEVLLVMTVIQGDTDYYIFILERGNGEKLSILGKIRKLDNISIKDYVGASVTFDGDFVVIKKPSPAKIV